MIYRPAIALLIGGSLLTASPWRWACVVVLLLVSVAAARQGAAAVAAVGALGVVIVGAASGFVSSIWIAALVAGLLWWRVPSVRPHLGAVHPGQIDRVAAIVAFGTVVVAAIGLAVWAGWFGEAGFDSEDSSIGQIAAQIDDMSLWLFVPGALLFAVVNALAEEFVYRGVLLHNLLPLGVTSAVVLQAAAFGAVHLNGFPSGWLGVAMAAVYGLALGWLRVRTDGLLVPVAVHLTADVVIAFLVRLLI